MNTKITNNQLRQFGVIFAIGILSIFGLLIPYLTEKQASDWVLFLALPVGFIALLLPIILKPVYLVWMKIGAVLGWINTRIILTFVYFVVFMPVGLLMHLLGKDPMNRRFQSDENSYRIKTSPIDGKRMERPY